jgi:hypothetical protein
VVWVSGMTTLKFIAPSLLSSKLNYPLGISPSASASSLDCEDKPYRSATSGSLGSIAQGHPVGVHGEHLPSRRKDCRLGPRRSFADQVVEWRLFPHRQHLFSSALSSYLCPVLSFWWQTLCEKCWYQQLIRIFRSLYRDCWRRGVGESTNYFVFFVGSIRARVTGCKSVPATFCPSPFPLLLMES